MTYKIGDLVRVLVDEANSARVLQNDVLKVTSINIDTSGAVGAGHVDGRFTFCETWALSTNNIEPYYPTKLEALIYGV